MRIKARLTKVLIEELIHTETSEDEFWIVKRHAEEQVATRKRKAAKR